jgi:predicted nuclease of predicted toxin-antitoxin system
VKLRDFPLLTDENIDPDVVVHLRQEGFDVSDVIERGLNGAADLTLLRLAASEGRVVVTHDADFGTLAMHQGEPLIGLLYLRPAHIDPKFTIESLQAVLSADPDLEPPFILVVKRSRNKITIRVRHLGP